MGRSAIILALTAAIAAAQGSPACAQQKAAPLRKDAPATETPQPAPDLPPPYEPQILKLAEILGSLAFLSNLCGAPAGIAESGVWREKAQSFLDAERMPEPRRERFAGAYNRGFESYRLVYHRCTPNARLSMERLMGDGAAVTRDLAGRFGG